MAQYWTQCGKSADAHGDRTCSAGVPPAVANSLLAAGFGLRSALPLRKISGGHNFRGCGKTRCSRVPGGHDFRLRKKLFLEGFGEGTISVVPQTREINAV